jgi:hypothetical protein
MSITFFLVKHDQFKVTLKNPDFDETSPADPIFNPRTVVEDLYPSLNMSNSNAFTVLSVIFGSSNSKVDYHGTLSGDELDNFTKSILSKIRYLHENNHPNKEYLIMRMKELDRICRYAIALNDTVAWC